MKIKKEKLLNSFHNNEKYIEEELKDFSTIEETSSNKNIPEIISSQTQLKPKSTKYRKIFLLLFFFLFLFFSITLLLFFLLPNNNYFLTYFSTKPKSANITKTLIIFDFDQTLTDDDSFSFLIGLLPSSVEMNEIFDTDYGYDEDWSKIMSRTYSLLKKNNITISQINSSLSNFRLSPGMADFLYLLKSKKLSKNFYILVLSGSNSYQIEYTLKNEKVIDIFDGIIALPSLVKNDTIVVEKQKNYENNCDICNEAQCKSKEFYYLKEISKKKGIEFDKVVFICDGYNDYCLARNLNETDLLMVKKGFGLDYFLNDKGMKNKVKAEIIYWENAWDLTKIFNEIF